jgi:predicted enzyme involved in methoxymalonyl-ACP biosynthesis
MTEKSKREKPSFSYRLKYRCQNNFVHIDADPQRIKDSYRIHVNTEESDETQQIIDQVSLFDDSSESQHDDLGKSISPEVLNVEKRQTKSTIIVRIINIKTRLIEILKCL